MSSKDGKYEISSDMISAVLNTHGAYLEQIFHDDKPVVVPTSDGKETHGGAAVLIPYANRVRDARYRYGGSDFVLPKNNGENSIHGLVRDLTFNCEEVSDDFIELTCRVPPGMYPSELLVDIKYSIDGGTFRTEVRSTNAGKKSAPYMAGFHPYFYTGGEWNLTTGESVRELRYKDSYFPDGSTSDFDFNKIANLQKENLDNCFVGGGTITIGTGEHSIEIRRKNFPYFVVYNGEYARGISAAVEPMTGAPDCFNNGIDRVDLEPGSAHFCEYSITLK